jgi:hypothetical protein
MHAAEAVVNVQVHLRRRLMARARSRAYTRLRPRTGSGRHLPSGSSTAISGTPVRSSIKLLVSLFSILPLIFLSERLLSTTDQSTDRSGIEFEGGSQFGIAETVAAQKQQPRLAPAESGQNAANLLLLLCCGVRFLRVRRRPRDAEQPFIALAPILPAQLIERDANRAPIEPAAGLLSLRAWIPPESPKDLNRQFLRAGRVSDDSGNDAGNAFVMNVKDGLEIESSFTGLYVVDDSARCAHKLSTTHQRDL